MGPTDCRQTGTYSIRDILARCKKIEKKWGKKNEKKIGGNETKMKQNETKMKQNETGTHLVHITTPLRLRLRARWRPSQHLVQTHHPRRHLRRTAVASLPGVAG
jgi:chromosome segregation and condensation protein ScpB